MLYYNAVFHRSIRVITIKKKKGLSNKDVFVNRLSSDMFVDMVAVPDFGPEAMGNWGLILYKESSMLFDPEESSESDKQGVAMLVSHELAHQVRI